MPSGPLHLVRRFVGTLRAVGPTADEERRLIELLTPRELALYRAQPAIDRRHSLDCAAAVWSAEPDAAPVVAVASALHDVGKADAALGVGGRVVATVVGALVGERRTRGWRDRSDVLGRIGRYRHHDERGAELLAAAGSDALVVAWAREHHHPAATRTIDVATAEILESADV